MEVRHNYDSALVILLIYCGRKVGMDTSEYQWWIINEMIRWIEQQFCSLQDYVESFAAGTAYITSPTGEYEQRSFINKYTRLMESPASSLYKRVKLWKN